ncbi:MAG: peptidylprolyl isomerase [Candidatus Phosphoribacter sp.]
MREKQPIFAVLGVLLVVIGFVWVANIATAPPSDQTPPPLPTSMPTETSTATSTDTVTPTPTPTPSVLAGCTEVPAPQAAPQKMTTPPDIEAARGKTFVATITTNCGPLTIELDGGKAPATVASFILLGNSKYWEPSACHRLTGDEQGVWVVQCGDPTGTGEGSGPGYHFGIENAPADGKYPRGTVAMARTSDPNSIGDQFFIVYKDTALPVDGGGYTVFGQVTAGMELLDKIAAAGVSPVDQMSPMAPLAILSVSVKPKA